MTYDWSKGPVMAIVCKECHVIQPPAEKCAHCGKASLTLISYPDENKNITASNRKA